MKKLISYRSCIASMGLFGVFLSRNLLISITYLIVGLPET